MHISYHGPGPQHFPTLSPPLELLPSEPGQDPIVYDLPLADVQEIRGQLGDAFLTFLDGKVVEDTCPTCHNVTYHLEETNPPRQGSWLRASFDGTLTHPESHRSYTFIRDVDFEVDVDDVAAFTGLNLADQRLIDLSTVPDDLSELKKPDLVDLAHRLGLSEDGTVVELRERIEAWKTHKPKAETA